MKSSTKLKKDVRVIIKKKNIPSNQQYKGGKIDETIQTSGRQKKVQGFADYFGMSNDPRFRELMQENGDQGNQNNINTGGFDFFQNGNGENGFQKIIINPDIWGNDEEGQKWVEEQQRRKKHNELTFQPGQVEQITPENAEEDQIIYIEPDAGQQKLEQLRKEGKPFYDQEFPPTQQSLSGQYGHISDWQPIKWKKLSATFKSPKIFVDKANPRDIKQGFLGDCYLLAGLAALAEKPHRIFDLFLLTQKNQMNYYSVKMIYRGKWRTINLDQHIPYVFTQPAFSKSDKQQLWVMLLEKAWSKMYGSYKHIQAGFAQQPLHDFTGAPIKHVFLNKKPEKNWEYLVEGSELQYAMVASSNPGSDTTQSSSGIVQGHAYSFLNATYLQTENGEERIVQLRNPWGQGQFKGKWSDYDEDWKQISQQEKKKVKFDENRNDGIFFMRYEDYIAQFNSMTVAEINDNASYVYESCVDKNCQGVYFTINITKPGKYSFQVDKTPERAYFGDKQYNFRYPAAQISLGKISQNRTQKFRGLISKRRTLFQSHDLVPGTYVAQIKIQYDPFYEKDFEVTLAVYSEYVSSIRLSTKEEAIQLTGRSDIEWTGKKDILLQSEHMGRSLSKAQKVPDMKKNNKEEIHKKTNESKIPEQPEKLFHSFSHKKTPPKKKSHKDPKTESKQTMKDHNNSLSKMSLLSSRERPSSNTKSLLQKVPGKGKRIRIIEAHSTKVTFTNQKTTGETVIKKQTTENKKQTLNTHNDGKKIKQLEKKVEAEENQFMGETLKVSQNYVETIETAHQKPDGQVIRKVEKKEGQVETIEEDDDSEDGMFSELKEEQEQQQQMQVQQKTNQQSANISFHVQNQSELGEEEKKRILEQMEKRIYKGKNKHTVNIQIDVGED